MAKNTLPQSLNLVQLNNGEPVITSIAIADGTQAQHKNILELVKQNKNAWEFSELVRPILNIYPLDTFELITNQMVETLSLNAFSHSDYRRIRKNLQLLKEIKGMEEQKALFIKRLKKQFRQQTKFLEALEAFGY